MKKTMFITSVIMVVVLAIALTTSSLAWFAAGGNQTVQVNAINVSAATDVSAAGLLIATTTPGANNTWEDGDFVNAPINLSVITLLQPAAPVGLLSGEGATDYGITLDAASFAVPDQQKLWKSLSEAGQMRTNKTFIDNTNSNAETFQGSSQAAPAAIRYFAVANSGETAITNLAAEGHFQVKVVTTKNANGETVNSASDLLGREATVWALLFDISDPDSAKLVAYGNNKSARNTFSYASTQELMEDGHVTEAVDGQFAINKFGTLPATTYGPGSLNTNTGAIVHGEAHHYALVVWYDGDDLSKGSAGTEVQVSVKISTTTITD